MRRWSTALVVVAVAAVAVFAAADALRGHDEPKASAPAPTITRPEPPTLHELLRRTDIIGFVVYSDHDCRLHSLLLPGMEDDVVREEGGSAVIHCRFEAAGGRILEEDEVMSPDRSSIARCRGGTIEVRAANNGIVARSIRGCPPAWRPDGRLTYPRGGAIFQEGRPLFTARELRRAARLHPNVARVGAGIPIFAHATGSPGWTSTVSSLRSRSASRMSSRRTWLFFSMARRSSVSQPTADEGSVTGL
jgi:hypothetical protein